MHAPLHTALTPPADAPYVPAGHRLHEPEAPVEYCPGAQMLAVALVDPAGHAYPAGHAPLHVGIVNPAAAP